MKQACNYSEKVWTHSFSDDEISLEEKEVLKSHLNTCIDCSTLHTNLHHWTTDIPDDNHFLLQKVITKLKGSDQNYSTHSRLALRFAFGIVLFVGVSLGFIVKSTLFEKNTTSNALLQNQYDQSLKTFSNDTYYSEIKSDEIQSLLLSEAN